MYPYIDDIFNAQISRDSVILSRDASVCLHLQLGYVINLAKSSLIPSEEMTHLGAWVDTLNCLVKPSLDKVQEINQVSADLLANGCMSAGRLQSVVDLMASCHATVSVSTRTIVISPVQELQVEVGSHQEDHSLGRPGGRGSSPVLVGPLSRGRGRPSGLPAVRSDTDNRRLQLWLGSSPRRQPLLGKVDSSGVKIPHKHSRDNGSPQSDPLLSGEPSGRNSSGSDRQHHSPVLSEPDGRDQVPVSQPVNPGHHSVASGQVDHNSSESPVRGRQHRGGHYLTVLRFAKPNWTAQWSGLSIRN